MYCNLSLLVGPKNKPGLSCSGYRYSSVYVSIKKVLYGRVEVIIMVSQLLFVAAVGA